MKNRRTPSGYRAARGHNPGLPFLSLLADACADARIPVPLPERGRPVTGLHAIAVERTDVRPASDFESLSSVVPSDVDEPPIRRPERRRGSRSADRPAPLPRRRSRRPRRVEPEAAAPAAVVAKVTAPLDESTVWDPAPPAAMDPQAERQKRAVLRPGPTRRAKKTPTSGEGLVATKDPVRAKKRAEEIFERAMASYRRGDVRQARTDAMLARVFDPDHAVYARAERTWTAEISRTGAQPRLCSAPSSQKTSGPSRSPAP